MRSHDLGDDLILGRQLDFEIAEFCPEVSLACVAASFEGRGPVLEELLLSSIEYRGVQAVPVADV